MASSYVDPGLSRGWQCLGQITPHLPDHPGFYVRIRVQTKIRRNPELQWIRILKKKSADNPGMAHRALCPPPLDHEW